LAAAAALMLITPGCAGRTPARPAPAGTTPAGTRTEVGLASFYGPGFHGRRTASGQPFDMRALVAAHPTLPFGTRVGVTNLANRRRIVVTIVDRGPTRPNRAEGVIIDLSRGAAEQLRFLAEGRTRVRLEVLK
jgi:rare lipoprotein A